MLLCGLMFVLESDIIFVYTSLRFLCHYLRLATMSQLLLDAGLSSLYFSCHTASCLALEGTPINFQWERGGGASMYQIVLTSGGFPTNSPLCRGNLECRVRWGKGGRMKCWITAESAGAVTKPSFTGGWGRCSVVLMFDKFLESYVKKKKKGQFSSEQLKNALFFVLIWSKAEFSSAQRCAFDCSSPSHGAVAKPLCPRAWAEAGVCVCVCCHRDTPSSSRLTKPWTFTVRVTAEWCLSFSWPPASLCPNTQRLAPAAYKRFAVCRGEITSS